MASRFCRARILVIYDTLRVPQFIYTETSRVHPLTLASGLNADISVKEKDDGSKPNSVTSLYLYPMSSILPRRELCLWT